MTIADLLMWIEATPVATAIRESAVIFPWIEGAHVIAATFVFGAIAIIDLRLLGVFSKNQAVSRLTDELVPWVWGAFALALLTGALLFSSIAQRYFDNWQFRIKMLLLITAGFNMLLFHAVTYRGVARWDVALPPPLSARAAGLSSLALWVAVIAFGRWIGFTIG